MLRTCFSSPGARGVPKAIRPILRTSPLSIPTRSLAQRNFTASRALPKSNPGTGFVFSTSSPRPLRPQTILQRLRSSIRKLHNSRRGRLENNGAIKTAEAPEPEPTSLGGRLKRLSREYGWSAVGVYLMLSALDFPFCYLLVRYLGTDRIGEWEDIIVSNVKKVIPDSVKTFWHEWRSSMKKAEESMTGGDTVNETVEMAGWGVERAEANNKRDASLATQLALAYAIHKSFIFVRIPLTAAVVPKVVKVLRGWGWDIGKRTTKEAKAIRRAQFPRKPKAKYWRKRGANGK